MEIVINNSNINDDEITNTKEKVRALIVTEDKKILVGNYAGIILLPGGKVDNNESVKESIIRELEEELGVIYREEDLSYFFTLLFYQKNYPCRSGNICNRKLITHYYLVPYKNIQENKQNLTENEVKNGFYLELLTVNELKNKLNKLSNVNPRSIYFKEELNCILEMYITKYTNSMEKEELKTRKRSVNNGKQ